MTDFNYKYFVFPFITFGVVIGMLVIPALPIAFTWIMISEVVEMVQEPNP